MTFARYKNNILYAAGALVIAWLIYLTAGFVSLPHIPTDAEIVSICNERTEYARDRDLITGRFERWWSDRQKADSIHEKLAQGTTTLQSQLERLIAALEAQQSQSVSSPRHEEQP